MGRGCGCRPWSRCLPCMERDRRARGGFAKGWLRCVTCGRLFHPKASTCGNYCEAARDGVDSTEGLGIV